MKDDASQLFLKLDINRDGLITLDEFCKGQAAFQQADPACTLAVP
jgi:hypothetical protein